MKIENVSDKMKLEIKEKYENIINKIRSNKKINLLNLENLILKYQKKLDLKTEYGYYGDNKMWFCNVKKQNGQNQVLFGKSMEEVLLKVIWYMIIIDNGGDLK